MWQCQQNLPPPPRCIQPNGALTGVNGNTLYIVVAVQFNFFCGANCATLHVKNPIHKPLFPILLHAQFVSTNKDKKFHLDKRPPPVHSSYYIICHVMYRVFTWHELQKGNLDLEKRIWGFQTGKKCHAFCVCWDIIIDIY